MHIVVPFDGSAGLPVRVAGSALVLPVVVACSMALPRCRVPPPVARWSATGVLVGLLLFLSLLAHELTYAFVARQHVPPKRIVLSFYGGETEFTAESPTPRTEFLISAAGPVTNLLAGGVMVLTVATGARLGMPVVVSVGLSWTAIINVVLAVLTCCRARRWMAVRC